MSNIVERIKLPSYLLFVGKMGSGKTHMMKWMIYHMLKKGMLDYGLIICPTKFTGVWDIIPDKYVHSEFTEEAIKSLLKLQARSIKKKKGRNCFLILDDCLGTCNLEKRIFTELYSSSRNYNITIFLSVQHWNDAPKGLRSNCNYVFPFFMKDPYTLDSIRKAYLMNHFRTKEEWIDAVYKNLGNYNFFLIDNYGSNEELIKSKADAIIPKYYIKY